MIGVCCQSTINVTLVTTHYIHTYLFPPLSRGRDLNNVVNTVPRTPFTLPDKKQKQNKNGHTDLKCTYKIYRINAAEGLYVFEFTFVCETYLMCKKIISVISE